MFKILKQLNMLDEFIDLVRLLLHDNNLLVKINGHAAKSFRTKNGVKHKDAASLHSSTSSSSNLSSPSFTPQTRRP